MSLRRSTLHGGKASFVFITLLIFEEKQALTPTGGLEKMGLEKMGQRWKKWDNVGKNGTTFMMQNSVGKNGTSFFPNNFVLHPLLTLCLILVL